MNKIVDYRTVVDDNVHRLDEKVRGMFAEGFRPYGDQYASSTLVHTGQGTGKMQGTLYVQPMIKVEETAE